MQMNWCVGMLLCSYVIFSCALGNPTAPPNSVEVVETSPAVDDPKLPVSKNALSKRYVVCPGNYNYCPNGNICCPQVSGKYTCCPALDAVCCSGFKHCCAYGYKCHLFGCQRS